jgi:L-arabinokinase
LFGARITGGGSGGTVAVLGRSDAGKVITEIAEQYRNFTGYSPYVFSGSSPGASLSGTGILSI